MTVYSYPPKEQPEQQIPEEVAKQIQDAHNRELGAKAIAGLVSAIVKPAFIMLLWNWLLPGIFGLATIGYFKALGLYVLARLIIDKE